MGLISYLALIVAPYAFFHFRPLGLTTTKFFFLVNTCGILCMSDGCSQNYEVRGFRGNSKLPTGYGHFQANS